MFVYKHVYFDLSEQPIREVTQSSSDGVKRRGSPVNATLSRVEGRKKDKRKKEGNQIEN